MAITTQRGRWNQRLPQRQPRSGGGNIFTRGVPRDMRRPRGDQHTERPSRRQRTMLDPIREHSRYSRQQPSRRPDVRAGSLQHAWPGLQQLAVHAHQLRQPRVLAPEGGGAHGHAVVLAEPVLAELEF